GARVGSRLPGASRPGGLRGGAAAGRTLPFLLGLLFFALCIPRSSRMDRTDPARRRELVRRSRRNGRPPAAGAAARSSAMGASVGWAREVRSEGDPRIGEAKLVRRGPRLAVPPALSPRGEAGSGGKFHRRVRHRPTARVRSAPLPPEPALCAGVLPCCARAPKGP
ncbi:unnamed protein product, partial [Prorocentrum cordatum]